MDIPTILCFSGALKSKTVHSPPPLTTATTNHGVFGSTEGKYSTLNSSFVDMIVKPGILEYVWLVIRGMSIPCFGTPQTLICHRMVPSASTTITPRPLIIIAGTNLPTTFGSISQCAYHSHTLPLNLTYLIPQRHGIFDSRLERIWQVLREFSPSSLYQHFVSLVADDDQMAADFVRISVVPRSPNY